MLRFNALTLLLIIGLALRSLVASGYMLDTESADGQLSIRLCNGPAGMNALPASEHAHHSHHDHHASHDTDKHEHETEAHDFSTCHLWNASTPLLAQLASIEFTQLYRYDEPRDLHTVLIPLHVTTHRHARAPPALT